MSATRQIVSWSLERSCVFRTADDWFLPDSTADELSDLRQIVLADREQRIYDGVLVLNTKKLFAEDGNECRIPEYGRRVSEMNTSSGSWKDAREICSRCEANVRDEKADEVAGCHGYIYINPELRQLDKQLREIAERQGLVERIHKSFVVTSPLWYGFWIESPLSNSQCQLLRELFKTFHKAAGPFTQEAAGFLRALTVSIDHEIPLHVSLAPPGHIDLGWRTVFWHCPRCKAGARNYSDEVVDLDQLQNCDVCNFGFVPSHNSSRSRWDWPFQHWSLEQMMGRQEYLEFVRSYLIQHGHTEEEAECFLLQL